MKEIGCQNFQQEIDELESGQLPGAKIQAHLQDCGSCRSFYDDRQKLRQMIAGLETVEAPNDFDFRLRAGWQICARNALSVFSFGLVCLDCFAVLAILVGVGLYMRATDDSTNEGRWLSRKHLRQRRPYPLSRPVPSIQTQLS